MVVAVVLGLGFRDADGDGAVAVAGLGFGRKLKDMLDGSEGLVCVASGDGREGVYWL